MKKKVLSYFIPKTPWLLGTPFNNRGVKISKVVLKSRPINAANIFSY